MWTGLAAPSRIGPTLIPCPATILRALKVAFAASRFGMIRRFASAESRVREDAVEQRLAERRISMHLAFDFEIGRAAIDQFERVPHLAGRRIVGGPEVGMRHEGDARRLTEASQLGCGQTAISAISSAVGSRWM